MFQAAHRRKSLLVLLTAALAAAVGVTYWSVPTTNMGHGPNAVDEPVDVLLVLGSPAEIDGSLTEAQRWRVDEAVREYHAGRAPRLLFAGGAAANRFIEAEVMSRYAETQGVPAGAVLREGRSTTTLENLRNCQMLLQAHGWHSVEVVSSADHLPRAAALLLRTPLRWRVHAAPTPGRRRTEAAVAYAEGVVGTVAIRWFGPASEPVLHLLALAQHRLAFGIRWVYYRLR